MGHGGVGHAGVGGSCRGGWVGHARVGGLFREGWGGSCRGGVEYVMQRLGGVYHAGVGWVM